MTANQIEYQKMLETKRHNIITEGYEGDLKRAQTQEAYASIDLLREQVNTQATIQAANLAGAAASYASAALSYERVNTEQTQQDLNRERSNTEVAQQYGILTSGAYAEARTKGQNIQNTINTPAAIGAAGVTGILTDEDSWISKYYARPVAVMGSYYNTFLTNGFPDVANVVQTNNKQRNDVVVGAFKGALSLFGG